jgi:excisionase family DNA binding protein
VGIGRRLTVSEASRVLGLSRTTLLAAEEAGQLTALRTPGGHRRYDPAELRRYAERAGATGWEDPTAAPPEASTAGPEAPAIAAAARAALRALAQALEADSAGLYLMTSGEPGFTAGFGVPRWLAERLTAASAPAPVVAALDGRRPCPFDPAAAGFPEPRSTGHGGGDGWFRWSERPEQHAAAPPDALSYVSCRSIAVRSTAARGEQVVHDAQHDRAQQLVLAATGSRPAHPGAGAAARRGRRWTPRRERAPRWPSASSAQDRADFTRERA